MSWNRRQATCQYCHQLIEVSNPMVVCQHWNMGKRYRQFYHIQCWVDNGMDYLRLNPYVAAARGRKHLQLSLEDRKRRRVMLVRHAALTQRIKKLKAKYPDSILPVLRVENKMIELAKEIEVVGGIPEKWLR